MTVQELIDALSLLPPDLEVWQHDPYGTGVRKAMLDPRIVIVATDPRGRGLPRFEDQLQYMTNTARWAGRNQAVRLS